VTSTPGATSTATTRPSSTPSTTSTGGIQVQTQTKPSRPLPPATHVRLPATFTIAPDGTLNPPVIAVPASLPVQLTVVSKDGHAHHVVLQSAVPRALSVPANGKGSVLLTGLHKGDYKVVVDGKVKGSLSIGVQVGP
jgi:hypothetical protein